LPHSGPFAARAGPIRLAAFAGARSRAAAPGTADMETRTMNQKRWVFGVTLIAVGLGAACERETDEPVRMDPPPAALGVEDEQQPTPGFDVLQVGTLRPAPNAAETPTGRVTLLMPSAEAGMPDGMQIEARVDGLEGGVEYGWHLHMGSCDEPGPVLVGISPGAEQEGALGGQDPAVSPTRAVGQPLVATAAGSAAQVAVLPTAQITPDMLPLRPYSVRIYRGLAPDPEQLVACADLGTGGEPLQTR
jgi:hypothetical protein